MTTEQVKMTRYSLFAHIFFFVSANEGVDTIDGSRQSMERENIGSPSKNIAKGPKIHVEKDFIGFYSSTPSKFSSFI